MDHFLQLPELFLKGWIVQLLLGPAIVQCLSLEGNNRKGVGLQLDFVRLSWGFGRKLLAEVCKICFSWMAA